MNRPVQRGWTGHRAEVTFADSGEAGMDTERWANCTDCVVMLAHLRGRVVERKLRLLACACVRRHFDALGDSRSRRAVEVGELFADGLVSEVERFDAWDDASDVPHKNALSTAATHTVEAGDLAEDEWAVVPFILTAIRSIVPAQAESRAQCDLLRCIFGPRPLATPPRVADEVRLWDNRTVPRLARTIYDEHAFADLPVLADALEDAGCTDEELLLHLRGPGPHARGCFALDACLMP
jgi:hypothetical protein